MRSLVMVLLLVASNARGLPSAGLCDPGDPHACDDGVDCTRDRCVLGVCVHEPRDADCDGGECALAACLPASPRADRHGCVRVAVHEGDACTDDGFACTLDVCTTGVCLHVPVDAGCTGAATCGRGACVPSRSDHDADGCVAGAPVANGAPCAGDGDVCTRDVCRGTTCAHEPDDDVATCTPLQQPFRQASGLENLAGGLAADVSAGDGDVAPLVVRLARIQQELGAAAAALDGDANDSPTTLFEALRVFAAGVLGPAPAVASGLTAQERARIAFTHVLRTPREISAFLKLVADARARAAFGPGARDVRRRGRTLLTGTRRLRAGLKRAAS